MDQRITEKIKTAEQKIARAERSVARQSSKTRAEQRRERTHRLCTIGGMIESWIGADLDPDALADMLRSRCVKTKDGKTIPTGEYLKYLYIRSLA